MRVLSKRFLVLLLRLQVLSLCLRVLLPYLRVLLLWLCVSLLSLHVLSVRSRLSVSSQNPIVRGEQIQYKFSQSLVWTIERMVIYSTWRCDLLWRGSRNFFIVKHHFHLVFLVLYISPPQLLISKKRETVLRSRSHYSRKLSAWKYLCLKHQLLCPSKI